MENTQNIIQQQKLANQFWQAHFSDLLDTPVTEQVAIEVDLWERLQTAMASQDKDTLRAIIVTQIGIPIQATDMFFRITRLAKQAIDKLNKSES